jgi:hypothetical protein
MHPHDVVSSSAFATEVISMPNACRNICARRRPALGGMAWIARTALDGLREFFGPYEMPTQLRERIAGDVQAVADALVMERLTHTG